MKIAIQGHPTRGKDVLQILKMLGATSYDSLSTFGHSEWYWYINDKMEIKCDLKNNMCGFKFYTVEEFEKKFPFKVGDKVIHKEFNDFFEVISFNPESSYPYEIKGVCKFNTKSHVLTKWQPKMKEERFVTLTLDKAKEWYKKGGELKEIALQVFTETELNPLPRSWEEFCDIHSKRTDNEYFIEDNSDICKANAAFSRLLDSDKNLCPSKKSAEAHLAMIQLEQLRNCWRQSWEPDWNDDQQTKYCIVHSKEFKIHILYETRRFLSFPTNEMAREFLECFRDLIEKAKDLI